MISDDVLPDAAAIVVHDIPRGSTVTADGLKMLLDDLLALAVVIEEDSSYVFAE